MVNHELPSSKQCEMLEQHILHDHFSYPLALVGVWKIHSKLDQHFNVKSWPIPRVIDAIWHARFYARASFIGVYALFEKHSRRLNNDVASVFISTNHDSLLITISRVSLVVDSNARVPAACLDLHRASSSLNVAVPKIRVRRSGGDVSTKRRKTQPHESVISIIAPRKRNRTRKIFIFCTAVNDESNRGNAPSEHRVPSAQVF